MTLQCKWNNFKIVIPHLQKIIKHAQYKSTEV